MIYLLELQNKFNEKVYGSKYSARLCCFIKRFGVVLIVCLF